jgi:hypothetical protein
MTDFTTLDTLQQTLNTQCPDQAWLRLLEVFVPVGLADMLQLQQATGFDRDKVNRLLILFARLQPDRSPIVTKLSTDIARPGQRSRPPKIYLLSETGAALLRQVGHEDLQACGLKGDTAIAHARGLLDVYLAAKQQQGLAIVIDSELPYGDKVIRPDALVTVGEGTLALFEIEQSARADLLRRLQESLRHKLAFFGCTDPARAQVSTVIRMLLALPRGKDFDRTLGWWQQAIKLVTADGRSLPFQLLVMPLADFISSPDWNAEQLDRWIDLTAAPLTESGATPQASRLPAPASESARAVVQLPKGLTRRSTHDDRLVLESLWHWFIEHASQEVQEFQRPTPEFFEIFRVIYKASHDRDLPVLEYSAFPHASLYLLNQYLRMHSDLRENWNEALRYGSHRTNWNPTMVLHKMQVAIHEFTRYHGWDNQGALQIFPSSSNWDDDGDRTFTVHVRIYNGELLMLERDGVVPGSDEIAEAETALGWVLWAMFAHARHLGLVRPGFW